jgi:hypothetical protein
LFNRVLSTDWSRFMDIQISFLRYVGYGRKWKARNIITSTAREEKI